MSVEGTSTQSPRPMPEPKHDISCPSVAWEVVGKMPKFSTFSGDSTLKGEVTLEQWAFEVRRCDAESHTSDIEGRNSMILMQSCG